MTGTSTFCKIRVGEVTIGLECPSPGYAHSLAQYFGQAHPSDDAPDIQLRLTLREHSDRPSIPNSLFQYKRAQDGDFSVGDDLARGHFDAVRGCGWLEVKQFLTKGDLTRVFEQLIYQAFYSARNVRGYAACLVHSSGVIRDGKGYLFVGASGSGKSTVAGLSSAHQVINDEIDLVAFHDAKDSRAGATLCSTPFNGLFRAKTAGQAPLQAVLLLAHASEHRLEHVSQAEAVTLLTSQIVPPLGLDEAMSTAVHEEMLNLAESLSRCAPLRRLCFRPDAGFWQVLDDLRGESNLSSNDIDTLSTGGRI